MKLKVEFSENSIDNAISELEKYRQRLKTKLVMLVTTLASEGVTVAGMSVSSTKGDSKLPDVDYEINTEGEIVRASIRLIGEDVLFVEFGAGIAYNSGKQHPKAEELGYGPGTYPSDNPPNKAINPGYWYYSDSDNAGKHVSKRSIGTEASMPLNNAIVQARNNYITKAIEVFRS